MASGTVAASRTFGRVTFSDRGTTSVNGKTELAVIVDSYSFAPTFVQCQPGQKITLQLTNDSSSVHNISLSEQQVDRDIPSKGKVLVDVAIPQSGVLLFFCKFHSSSRGMNGELLSGTA